MQRWLQVRSQVIQHWLNLTHVFISGYLDINKCFYFRVYFRSFMADSEVNCIFFFVCSSFVEIWLLYAAIIMQNLLICSYLKLFCSTERDIEIIAAEILFYWKIVLLQHSDIFVMQLLESQLFCFSLPAAFVLQHFSRSEIIWILLLPLYEFYCCHCMSLLLLLYEFFWCYYMNFAAIVWILLLLFEFLLLYYMIFICCYGMDLLQQVYGFYWCHFIDDIMNHLYILLYWVNLLLLNYLFYCCKILLYFIDWCCNCCYLPAYWIATYCYGCILLLILLLNYCCCFAAPIIVKSAVLCYCYIATIIDWYCCLLLYFNMLYD